MGILRRTSALAARHSRALLWVTVLAAALPGVSACGDPLRDRQIESLGDEQPNFPPGEFHRPGQPCVWCHSVYGGEEPLMSVAGTLFSQPDADGNTFLVGGYVVRLLDSEGALIDLEANACGNFFVKQEDYNPAYPIRAELYEKDPNDPTNLKLLRPMVTRIARDGSCAGCHSHPASPLSPGVVYVPAAPGALSPPDDGQCPLPSFAPQL